MKYTHNPGKRCQFFKHLRVGKISQEVYSIGAALVPAVSAVPGEHLLAHSGIKLHGSHHLPSEVVDHNPGGVDSLCASISPCRDFCSDIGEGTEGIRISSKAERRNSRYGGVIIPYRWSTKLETTHIYPTIPYSPVTGQVIRWQIQIRDISGAAIDAGRELRKAIEEWIVDIKTSAKVGIGIHAGRQEVYRIARNRIRQDAVDTIFDQRVVNSKISMFIGIAIHGVDLDLIRGIVIEDGIDDVHFTIHHQGVGIALVASEGAIGDVDFGVVSRADQDHIVMRRNVAKKRVFEAKMVLLLGILNATNLDYVRIIIRN